MRRILLPVDFSSNSRYALDYALPFAREIGAEILLYHTLYNFMTDNETNYESSQGSQKITQEILHAPEIEARREMEALVREIRENHPSGKPEVHYKMDKGVPDQNIADAAKDEGADLIIMGSRGKGNAVHQFFGSVASGIMEKASVPVMVIPHDCRYKPIRQVLYATNFDLEDREAMIGLSQILSTYQPQLHAVHVSDGDELEDDRQAMRELEEALQADFRDQPIKFELLTGKDVIEGVAGYVEKHDIQILSMLSHKRNMLSRILHPRVTRQMLFHANKPLLVFHAHS